MDDKLTYQLSSIIAAYKPHSPIPTKEELESDRVDNSYVSMVDLCQQIGLKYEPNKKLD
jgi:hypothetical protein